ncbi:nicotinate-nucleotide adenylyltransferase [Hellea balneolensis]|uniref:nicotinate-nucleotide adenylyltransferase n=1 Tax=Hellea balneolensis TaxID=287478 RepID=UPI0005590D9E|nr:nicotinate-nucleotide adenylyltransferase [Hellea balneolensis]
MLYDGLSVGLFGGSFNPAHAGHLHVAQCGLRELALDRVWWMVSPQNPLKPKQPSYDSRVQTVEALGLNNRMDISHMERDFGTQYTIDMIRMAQTRHPRTRFVFLMGADNFSQFPKWKNWQEIAARVPIAVIARPGDGVKPRLSKTARFFADKRLPEERSHILQYLQPPLWTFLTPPLNNLSSTAIRKDMAYSRKT